MLPNRMMISMRFDWRRLTDDLSGRWAFAPTGFLIFAPLYFIFSVLLGTKFERPITALAAMAANAISLSVCAIIFAAFYFTVFRNRLIKPVSIAWLIFAGFVLGFAKGYFTGLMMWQLGVDPDLESAILSRVGSTSVLGILVVITQPIMLSFRERYKNQRDALVSERVKLSMAPKDQLEKFAAAARRQLNAGENNEVGFIRSSELLRQIIRDELRPLSHRIWEQENARYTDFSFRDLYRLAVTRYAFPWKYVAPIYFVTGIGSLSAKLGFGQAIGVDLIITATIIVVFAFAKVFVPRGIIAASIYTVFVVALTTFIGGVAAQLLINSPNSIAVQIQNLGNGLWILELALTGAFIAAAVKSHQEIEQELVKLVGADAARKDSELLGSRIANRELAQYLHGHVQNTLLASALRLERAEKSNDETVLKQELDLVDNVLAAASEGFKPDENISLNSEMLRITTLWQGLLDVKITVDPICEKLRLSVNVVHDLAQAANEAITNAMRHGFASKITMTITTKNGTLELKATDDGTGPRSGEVGLGSALFDSLAGRRWSLTPAVGGGSVLTLRVRV
jgi:signal transduction histidine kinase